MSAGFAYSQAELGLDAVLKECADYFSARLLEGPKRRLVITEIDADTVKLSGYIRNGLQESFERNGSFTIIDYKSRDILKKEQDYQMQSGLVSDETALSITRQLGAEVIVSGEISKAGFLYYMTLRLTDGETGTGSIQNKHIRIDPLLAGLLDIQEEKKTVLAAFDAYNNQFALSVRGSRADNTYRVGDSLPLHVRAEKECWIMVIYVFADGTQSIFYPGVKDAGTDVNHFRAGEEKQIPNNRTTIVLEPPLGDEFLLVFAYDRPFRVPPEAAQPVKFSASAITRGARLEADGSSPAASGGSGPSAMNLLAVARYNYRIVQ
jgi:hypothetical protein